jgi:hypothetical protein
MTNDEIDVRLKFLAQAIPQHAQKLTDKKRDHLARELELLNMGVTAIYVMLGEIAKRLPEKSSV